MNRFITIDSFRGLLLVIMTVNHLPGPHREFTYDQIGYFTAAEGFVFISGLVAGLHGYKLLVEKGEEVMRSVFYRRAGLLYFSQMFLLALLFFFGWSMQALSQTFLGPGKIMFGAYAEDWSNSLHPLYSDLLPAWAAALTLLYQPPLFDVLPMYCIFLFFTPLLLCLANKQQGKWILWGSLLLWLSAQSHGLAQVLDFFPVNWGLHDFVFDPSAWQILFILGVLSGVAWRRNPSFAVPGYGWLIGCSALVFLGFIVRHAPVSEPDKILLGEWSYRGSLAPLRLFSSLTLISFFAVLCFKFPRLFTWPLLARLGRNSLWIFLYQIALVYVCGFWCDHILGGAAGTWLNLFVIALVTSTLWFAATWVDQIKYALKGESCWLADRLFTVRSSWPDPTEWTL